MGTKKGGWDVHDDIAAEGGGFSKGEYVIDELDDVVAAEWFMSQTMDNCEELVSAFAMTPVGRDWLTSKGWAWAEGHADVVPNPLEYVMSRDTAGWYEIIAANADNVEWGRHVDAVRETTHWYVGNDPGVLMAMAGWLLAFCNEDDVRGPKCADLMSRLRHMDVRVRDDRDWQLEAVTTYGFGVEST